jgi:hypothetical protein
MKKNEKTTKMDKRFSCKVNKMASTGIEWKLRNLEECERSLLFRLLVIKVVVVACPSYDL